MEKIRIDSKFADQSGEIMVVELGGHVDQSNSYQLQKMFDDIIESGCYKVIVDFKDLFYMSSAGWGVFVGEIKRFRENGGDIKLANMNPEIYDVYQMLEFYHILEDYPSVDDAASSFRKLDEALDLVVNGNGQAEADTDPEVVESTKEEIDLSEQSSKDGPETSDPHRMRAEVLDFTPIDEALKDETRAFIPHTLTKDVKLAELPIQEKIKRVVAQNPLVGIFGIKKILKHEHFGKTHVGFWRLMRMLRDLDLNTKEKRYRYYRSC